MRVIDLALKDLCQILRDRKAALFLVIMPLTFTFFFGMVSGGFGRAEDPRLPVGLVEHDQGSILSTGLENLLKASDTVRPVLLEKDKADEADELVRTEKLAGAVIVPAGFSEQVLRGQAVGLTFIANGDTSAGKMAGRGVQAAVSRLLGAVETARLSAETLEGKAAFESDAARQAYVEEALGLANEAWLKPPITTTTEKARGTLRGREDGTNDGLLQASPGMIVQFAVFGLVTSAMVFVVERKSKTLQRLLTTPISRAGIIAGHVLAMFTVAFLQIMLLVIVGQFVFGVDYLREPLAILLMAAALALWAAALGLLIGAVSKAEDQVVTWSLIAMFVFAAMGGAWFPLEVTGRAFATVGHFMPTAWAMDGLQNIVLRGLDFGSVLMPAAILTGYAAAFFALALWRFRFE